MKHSKAISITCKGLMVLTLANVLVGCGGGGGGGGSDANSSAAQVTPPTSLNDPAVSIRVASILVEASAASSNFDRQPLKDFPSFRIANSTTSNGCATRTYNNPDAIPSVGDKLNIVASNCQLLHAQTGGTLSQTYTEEIELITVGDPNFSSNTSWQFANRDSVANNATLSMKLANGLAFDGAVVSTYVITNSIANAADGSQASTSVYKQNVKETSLRGASEYTLDSTVPCKSAAGTAVIDCLDTRMTLVGKIYGIPVNAKLSQTANSPMTFEIVDGTTKITVTADVLSNASRTARFSVKTASGETIVLTGEDVSWLSGF